MKAVQVVAVGLNLCIMIQELLRAEFGGLGVLMNWEVNEI